MSKGRDEQLLKVLKQHLVGPGELERVEVILEPFWEIIERDEYRLAQAQDLDPEEVATAITRAVAAPVHRIAFCSLSSLWPQPDWMSKMVFAEAVSKRLNLARMMLDSVSRLSMMVLVSHTTPAEKLFHGHLSSKEMKRDLKETIEANYPIVKGLFPSVLPDCRTEYNLLLPIEATLWAYIHYALAHEWEMAEQVEPLLRLLSACVPYGERKDEKGTWIVLCG